jgi:hypothetical protein
MSVFFAATLPTIILMCGLVLDIGRLQLVKLQMQSAADAAAQGAALEAERGTGNWVAEGQDDAALNGFTDGANGVTVSVVEGTNFGAYSGDYNIIQATITQTVNTFFMKGLTLNVTAQAGAAMVPCIYLLGTGTLQTYTLDIDTGDMDGNTCPIYVNQNMDITAYSNINVEAIDVNGSSGSSIDAGETYPSPNYGYPSTSDPLSAITSPSFSSCTYTSYSKSGGSTTLSPGTYCKGLNLTNTTVTLNSGTYIITGGATWSGATVSGSGVTLYFTSGGGGTDSKFIITNYSNVTLSAPTSGSLAGILVFLDRNWTKTSAQDVALMYSTIQGDGIWYLPKTGLYFASDGDFKAPHYLGIVADNIYADGTNIVPSNNFSFVTTGNPFRIQAAVVQ